MTDNLLDKTDDDNLPEADPNKDYLTELVGEGRKFKDQQALAKSKYEADQYIEILKRRLDEGRAAFLKEREENTTKASLEELTKRIEERLKSNAETEVKSETNQFDPKQIESLVTTKLLEHEVTRTETNNFNLVKGKLQQRYGENYKEALGKQIEELDMTEATLNEMARRQPKVLLRTLGLDKDSEQQQFQSPPRGQRSNAFTPSGPAKRTWSYYQNLKKTKPDIWFDRSTAIQMQKDAIELGEAFQDGDYSKYN